MSAGCFADGRRAALSLSFDDARLSQVGAGIPLLDSHGVRASFYVSPDNVVRQLEGWQKAIAAGHEIGNHSLQHPCTGNFPWARQKALEDYTIERMEAELLGANQVICKLLEVTPTTFAYPCGQTFVGRGQGLKSYIPVVARHFAAGRGFMSEVANDPEFCDLANLCAFGCDERSFAEIKGWLDDAIEQGTWVVLAGHEMGEDGGRQTTRLSMLEALCRYCQDRQGELWVDTVAQVASHICRVRSEKQTVVSTK